ncbi:DUF1178 family protein [Ottowia sp. GY511]|uniref:DUF1178 family protein n=1 Tax=Ottowia flava TaxID=2675430 RepID=A0ABW4KYY4_9BURK|nr:DUF1178 family protein [Ottowia sp. GY511]TXK23338.1 DUF1178 family protein [Ottowia sp. GY511]
MKVLDLQCLQGHSFEGWFSSEDDFQAQMGGGLLTCPLCGEAEVAKLPSAPRLNLSGATETSVPAKAEASGQAQTNTTGDPVAALPPQMLQAAWLHMVRRVMANTEDVGQRFAEEARRMHYGESESRGIRGQASVEQTEELLDEGIAVMPLPVPDGFKDNLQ